MIAGTCYGVVLNAAPERARIGAAFGEAPYLQPPESPVVYIKPRTCFGTHGAAVQLPADVPELEVAATVAILFARDCGPGDAPDDAMGAACLAIDVSEPEASYYRPAIRQRCRDGFLPLGQPVGWSPGLAGADLVTTIDGVVAHRWSLADLVRPIDALVRELATFMTLRAGDMLLVGLPGDAPRASIGQVVRVESDGFAPLVTRIEAEV